MCCLVAFHAWDVDPIVGSLCLSRACTMRNDWMDWGLFGVEAFVGPRNGVLDVGLDPPMERWKGNGGKVPFMNTRVAVSHLIRQMAPKMRPSLNCCSQLLRRDLQGWLRAWWLHMCLVGGWIKFVLVDSCRDNYHYLCVMNAVCAGVSLLHVK